LIGRPPLPDDKLVAEIKAIISRISFTPRVHRPSALSFPPQGGDGHAEGNDSC
jgi:hypothetical protein